MAAFKALSKPFNFAASEKNTLSIWEERNTFQRSIAQKKEKDLTPYTFYDGPPFATGLPHYGHIVASSIKDTVARYWTMRGHFVERRFGWDTHGLPIEMETEKSLGLFGPKAIREYGIDKFNEACRSGVLKHTKDWRRIIKRIGRFVDFDNDYKTMDVSFMESVWWVFSKLWEKGLVYQGKRVMPYSVRLSTPLSNFEANLDYRQVQDPSLTIKVKLKNKDEYLLVWTTTPWTLPANLSIAIKDDIRYARVLCKEDSNTYILAKDLIDSVIKGEHKIIDTFLGKELIGQSYEPIYDGTDYKNALGDKIHNCFKVINAEHVTTESGTGLVHMAPAFGVEDFEACSKEGLPVFDPLDEEGRFDNSVPDVERLLFSEANKKIIKNLKALKKVYDHKTIEHSYPYCWRSHTPLIYKALPVWNISVPKIKELMVKHNDTIHWVPNAVGHKRFRNWLKNAADWTVSRNRFWGTPIPIWECSACNERKCIGSVSELETLSKQKINDLHSHYVDKLTFPCQKCNGNMQRISEVFDCWFESGSMPVAQIHYPFENKEFFENSFPADFIAEGLDQTRGWFYTLLVISTALFNKPPFKNVVVNGMVLASDGSKMSKSKKNFPDPEEVLESYGADAIRCYLLGSPVVRAEPLQFNEEGIKEVVRSVMLPLYNSWSFFVQYANIDNFDPKRDLGRAKNLDKRSEIDRWIISKLNHLIVSVNKEMSGYYLYKTISPMLSFIDDLTNWYIRRNRRRFWKDAKTDEEKQDKIDAYATLYEALVTFAKVIAPLMPFMSEALYQNLVYEPSMHKENEDSVHLTDYPLGNENFIDEDLESEVYVVRKTVSLGRALREKHRIKTRQPLHLLTAVTTNSTWQQAIKKHAELIKSELNIKQIKVLSEDDSLCKTSIKPNYKTLGPKLKQDMATVVKKIAQLGADQIESLQNGISIDIAGHDISKEDVFITKEAIHNVVVMSDENLLVAIDTHLDESLKEEGLMREALSQLQKLRKTRGLEVTDRIHLLLYSESNTLLSAIKNNKDYMSHELLADEISISSTELLGEKEILHIEDEKIIVKVTKA